mgnify:CR=1 FL=1
MLSRLYKSVGKLFFAVILCINPNNFIFTLRDRSKMQEYCCIYFRHANIYKSMETLNSYLNGVFLVFL